jgi:asparagine synthetase B (glutamine-hydrolysing)
MWLVTNLDLGNINNKSQLVHQSGYTFITTKMSSIDDSLSNCWFIDGYILPRHNLKAECAQISSEKLPDVLYEKYGENFINHIKGNFTLLQIYKNGFKIFSDHFGIKKFFIWQNSDKFIISSELNEISTRVELEPSAESMAIYALTYHFSAGITIFKDIRHNTPGQVIELRDRQIHLSRYWNPEELLNLPKREININCITDSIGSAIEDCLQELSENKISLSITGGADTRNLLAAFLKKGIKPHLYTYGNTDSADCLKAKAVAKGCELEHSVYDIKIDSDSFEQYARKIIRISGGLASVHRAHRLMAVENEAVNSQKMFLGTLGGEFIKGICEDDYIVSSIVYENWNNTHFSINDLQKYIRQKRLNWKGIDTNLLLEILQQEPFMQGKVISRKLKALTYITAHLHDAQDVNLFENVMDEVYTPFLDIDYLELLFSSNFTFDQKEVIENKYIKRMNNPVYSSRFLEATYKPLLKFRYSGEHKPSEVLFNKYYAAVIKFIRQLIKIKDPPNFPLGKWMEEFVEEHLPLCVGNEVINNTFDIPLLLSDFRTSKHIPIEAYWLKYTNPIMMRFILEEFNILTK